MWQRIINISNYLFGGLFNIGLAVGLIVVAYFVTTWAFGQGLDFFGSDDGLFRESREVVVEIPEEAGSRDIARILLYYELISNEWSFYLGAMLNGSSNHFLRGTFTLNTDMSESHLMEALQSTEYLHVEEGRIVVQEGLANWQIAGLAATLGYFTSAEFLYEAENGFFSHGFLVDITERANRLQGFLFPDTYNLPPNPVPRDLIVRQLGRFEEIYIESIQPRLPVLNEELGRTITLEQLIIIASIIEAEAVVSAERPLVASVIYNRLAANMPLEMISTVVYATNTRPDQLTAAQFQVNHPHNTFNRTGLPVGAITNPGLSSIEAALNPANTDYIYMAKRADGSHFFTSDRAAYLAARAEGDAE